MYFTIFDFRDVTRLFHDPDFDGPIEQDDDFNPHGENPNPPEPPIIDVPPTEKHKKFVLGKEPVTITQKHVQYLDKDGKLITESLVDYTKKNVLEQYASLVEFLTAWNSAAKKQVIVEELEKRGVFFDELQPVICQKPSCRPLKQTSRTPKISSTNSMSKSID